jgi:hypothetical protein
MGILSADFTDFFGVSASYAIDTKDTVRCCEAILYGKSDLLISVRDSVALKNALNIFMCNREFREG